MKPAPAGSPPYILRGRYATARWAFAAAEAPHPLAPYPGLTRQGRLYNFWLSDEILVPALQEWCERDSSDRAWAGEVRDGFESSSGRARLAFAEILPSAAAAGEPAVLAALGVTANLQRTLAILAEFLLAEQPPAAFATGRLSRGWCGLVHYPARAPYFPARPKRLGSRRLRPLRNDLGHLCQALWCSSATVAARSGEAIESLQREIRRSGILSAE